MAPYPSNDDSTPHTALPSTTLPKTSNLLEHIHSAINAVKDKQSLPSPSSQYGGDSTPPEAAAPQSEHPYSSYPTLNRKKQKAADPPPSTSNATTSAQHVLDSFVRGNEELKKLTDHDAEKNKKATFRIRNELTKSISPIHKGDEMSPEVINHLLSENQQMIYAIHENLRIDREKDLKPLFSRLQQNLLFLALLADQPYTTKQETEMNGEHMTEEEYSKNTDFWTDKELEALNNALRKPNQDLMQLQAAVRTKSAEDIHRYLKRCAESYKLRLLSIPKFDSDWWSLPIETGGLDAFDVGLVAEDSMGQSASTKGDTSSALQGARTSSMSMTSDSASMSSEGVTGAVAAAPSVSVALGGFDGTGA